MGGERDGPPSILEHGYASDSMSLTGHARSLIYLNFDLLSV